jgi:hypothetical protein
MKKGETFKRMSKLVSYFQENSAVNADFLPEFLISDKINTHISRISRLTLRDVQKMISDLNEIENQTHYDGAGWLDYRMHFTALMKINGYEIIWDPKKKMKIKNCG